MFPMGYNENLATQKYANELFERVNGFDVDIASYIGDDKEPDNIDNRAYPSGFSIYKIIDDYDTAARAGVLIVQGKCNSENVLDEIHQTKINATDGSIAYRKSVSVVKNKATAWTDWISRYVDSIPAANYPKVGQEGTAGIVKLGRHNGLIIDSSMLVVDPATKDDIVTKSITRKPIAPTNIAHAVAESTHQTLRDGYDPDTFTVVHSSRNEAVYFPTDKDRLPVSYKAVKDAMPYTVDDVKNVKFISGICGGTHPTESYSRAGIIYNNGFGVALAQGLWIQSEDFDEYTTSCCPAFVKITLFGKTVVIPINKFKKYDNGYDSYLFVYENFVDECPEFKSYKDEMPDGVVEVCEADMYYKIHEDGSAQFTKLTVPEIQLTAPDGALYKLTVNNDGTLITSKIS